MDPPLVVWVVPHADFELGNVRARLHAHGFDLVRCLPGLSSKIDGGSIFLRSQLSDAHVTIEVEARDC